MREKSSIFGAVGIAATNLSRWLLRMKRQPRTLKSPNHSLQAWWLNENRLHRARRSRLQQGSCGDHEGDPGDPGDADDNLQSDGAGKLGQDYEAHKRPAKRRGNKSP